MAVKGLTLRNINAEGDFVINDANGIPRIIVTRDGVTINGLLNPPGNNEIIEQPLNQIVDKLNVISSAYGIVPRGTNSVYTKKAGIYNNTTGDPVWTEETEPSVTQGYNVGVYDRKSMIWKSFTTYDIETTPGLAATLASALNALSDDVIVFLFTLGNAKANRTTALADAIVRCGGTYGMFYNQSFDTNGAYMLVGIPNTHEGGGIEAYAKNQGNNENWIDNVVTVTYGNLDQSSLNFREFDVNSPSVTIKKNYSLVGDTFIYSAGSAYIYGFDTNGEADVKKDGYIISDGNKVYIPRDPDAQGDTLLVNAPVYMGSYNKGYILFDTRALTTGNQWTINSSTVYACAFCIKVENQWKYDNNLSLVDFTPNEYTVCIGTIVTNTTGVITEAEICSEAVSIGTIGSSGTKDGLTVEDVASNYQADGDNVINTTSFDQIIAAPPITIEPGTHSGKMVLIKCNAMLYTDNWSCVISAKCALFRDSTQLIAKDFIKINGNDDNEEYTMLYRELGPIGNNTYRMMCRLIATGCGNVKAQNCYIEAMKLSGATGGDVA